MRKPVEAGAVAHMWQPKRFRKLVRTYFLERSLWQLPRDGSVLDLCCGYGFYFAINCRASGIDADERAVTMLARRGYAVRHGNVLEGVPYPDRRFAWVIAHDVLEHFTMSELRTVFAEVHRVLEDGGHFLVIVPNRKGYDYGVRAGVGHKLFVTAREIDELSARSFQVAANYPEPLPRWIGRHFTHNKEVFRLRKIA